MGAAQGLCNHFTVLVQALFASYVREPDLVVSEIQREKDFIRELLGIYASHAGPLYVYSLSTRTLHTCRPTGTAVTRLGLEFEGPNGKIAVGNMALLSQLLDPFVRDPQSRRLKWCVLCLESIVLARVKALSKTVHLPRDIYELVADYAFAVDWMDALTRLPTFSPL